MSDDQLALVQRAWSRGDDGQLLIDAFSLQIRRKDIRTLKGTSWLNDEVGCIDVSVGILFWAIFVLLFGERVLNN